MDHIRSCYTSSMALYVDRPDVLTKGRWYWCPVGAVNLPGPHLFTSSRWDNEKDIDPDIGEQASLNGGWYSGKANPRYKGKTACGFDLMQTGSMFADKGKPAVDSDGVPLCCNALPIPRAADAEGGEAVQGWGIIQTAQGGDGEDGGLMRPGGDADDGTSPQWSAYDEGSGGGDSEDGTAPQSSAYDEGSGGGDSEDGTAPQSSAYDEGTGGGDSDDGTATQATSGVPDVPIGGIFLWGSATPPANCVLCDGSSLSTSGTYAALFGVIAYQFGGSGANFNVPDMRGRMPVGIGGGSPLPVVTLGGTGGEKDHTLTTAEMPAHTHTTPNSLQASGLGTNFTSQTGTAGAATGSTGGGGSHNNMPPYIGVNWVIQYA